MDFRDVELEIFCCPHSKSSGCIGRFDCHPIPGFGTDKPEFLVLGLNPAFRNGIWGNSKSLDDIQGLYRQECMDPKYRYGQLLNELEAIVPSFRVRKTVYLSDLVKCPVIEGRPSEAMIEQCKSTYLEKTIQLLKPKFIVGFGGLTSEHVGGYKRRGNKISSSKIVVSERSYWFISAPHPSRATNITAIARGIRKVLNNPEAHAFREVDKNASTSTVKEVQTITESKLSSLGYIKENRGNCFGKGNKKIHVSYSSEFGSTMRILWKEQWRNSYATIYDYSLVDGPVCVVPMQILFESTFVRQKRSKGYGKSKDWWSQRFPLDHELSKLVLGFEEKWNLL